MTARRSHALIESLSSAPNWVVAFAIAALVIVCHLPLREGAYVLDDHTVVEHNLVIERGSVAEIFSTYWSEGSGGADRRLYRPASILSFALERRWAGPLEARRSRTINVALHVLVSWTLLALAGRIGASPLAARAGALLFAVHPVHVEVLAGAVGRAEILAALAGLFALWSLSHAGPWSPVSPERSASPGGSRIAAWSAGLALFVALLSKESALAIVPLMVGGEALFRPTPRPGARAAWWIDRAAALAPALLGLAAYLILRVRALESVAPFQRVLAAENPLVALDGLERLGTALGLVSRYAGLLLYPIRLSADYSGPVIPTESGLIGLRPLAGLALLAGCALLVMPPLVARLRGDAPSTGRAGAAYAALLLLLPYLIIGNLLFAVGALMAERFLYLPSLGFCLLIGLLFGTLTRGLPRSPPQPGAGWIGLALVILVVAFGTRSWARCLDWRDDGTLFQATVSAQPRSPRAHYILGVVLADRGDDLRALGHLTEASRLDPQLGAARLQRGVLLGRLGRIDEAEAELRLALERIPGLARGHYNLALVLRRQGRVAEAEIALRKAVFRDPAMAGAWSELGNLYLDLKRFGDAAEAYRRAIALGRADLAERLALAEAAIGRPARVP